MTNKDLFQEIGNIDEKFVLEAGGPAKKIRRIRLSKIAALAAAVVLICGFSVWAASSIIASRSGQSSSIPDYFSPPSAQTLQKDLGFSANILAAFQNGFQFQSGNISEDESADANGNVLEQYKSLGCWYKRGKDSISIYIDGAAIGENNSLSETVAQHRVSDSGYYAYVYKMVPGDYKKTKQDKLDETAGKYVFSYGSNKIETVQVQIVTWSYGGLNYSLCAMDTELSAEELVEMAKEFIDGQE